MKIITKPIRFIGRHFLNVRRWMAYDYLKNNAKTIYKQGSQVFAGSKAQKPESFNQAVDRLHLNDKDLQVRFDNCRKTFYLFATIASALALYTLYMLIRHSFAGALLGAAVTTLIGLHAFKYHFWMFQIKHKKLGCTFNEWKSGKVNKNK